MPTQLTHTETQNKYHNKEIVVVADAIRSPENVGMILRVSEAFGCKQVYFIGDSPTIENRRVTKTSRSTENNLELFFHQNESILTQLKENQFQLIGLEITDTSARIQSVEFSEITKIALIIGNERNGISKNLLAKLDQTVHFDLFGKNSSMNVVNALSVALYEITR